MQQSTDSPGLAGYFEEQEKRRAKLGPIYKELALKLAAVQVVLVSSEYDGCGDSGQIESVSYFNAANEDLSQTVEEGLGKQVQDFFYDLLEVRHGGWENNDGGFGSFTWNVAETVETGGGLSHEHNGRFTDYSTTIHQGLNSEGGQEGMP
jgi:hypothetical protein